MPPRIKPANLPRGTSHIPPAQKLEDAQLKFSFKLIDVHSNQNFCVDHCADGYLEKFLVRLRDVCQLSVNDFRTNKSRAIRSHLIDWSETTEPNGFTSLNQQLRDEEPWQFEITANAHGRVHGVLLGNTFYVVWIDPKHRLYQQR